MYALRVPLAPAPRLDRGPDRVAILVRTLLTFHFMAISVAWDARPEKKVKFSALFPKKLHKNTTNWQTFSPRVADP